ncbi:hypothetical protein ACS0TY_002759 [Phlomoides rotata]
MGESEELQFFYYFIESERSPENDPLILYLLGGPGCSSFSAIVLGIGPLMFDNIQINTTIPSLVLNPYSWTKVANILFLDQPVGTGFSYANSQDAYKSSDTISARLSYEFLKKWIIKHPNFQKNPLYLAGESFGGFIIPLIVDHVYNGIKAGSEPHLNMKGYILGNPGTDKFINFNGRITYAHQMGLLSDELYLSAKENCNGNFLSAEPNNYMCNNDMERINECIEKINLYHILEPSCDQIVSLKRELLPHYIPPSSNEEEIDFRHFLQSPPPESWCRLMTYPFMYYWMNTKLVQEALHVHEGLEWVRCNRTLQNMAYTYVVDSTVNYHKKFTDQTDCRVIIYSGDHDMAAPHSSTEEWIRSLKLQIKSDWSPWFVDGQIAGYKTVYFNGDSELTQATVKGAGHTPWEFKTLETLSMIDRWFSHNLL